MSLNISKNKLARGALKKYPGYRAAGDRNEHKWGSLDSDYEINSNAGVIALADGIKNNRALETITFGDEQAITMKADMTKGKFRGKRLGASGAMIVAAFLPKCQ